MHHLVLIFRLQRPARGQPPRRGQRLLPDGPLLHRGHGDQKTINSKETINPFLPDCKTSFSQFFFTFFCAILKFSRPEHDC